MSKHIIRICTLVVALVMCFNMTSVAFATSEFSGVTPVSSSEEGIMPMAVYELLRIDWSNGGYTGSQFYYVTPTKGSNLKIICKNDFQFSDYLTVKVTKEGGWWASKTLIINPGTNATPYDLINNCNGGTYKIEIFGNAIAQYYAMLIQADYA